MTQSTSDHYLPALTMAELADAQDQLTFMNNSIDIASVSMRSLISHRS